MTKILTLNLGMYLHTQKGYLWFLVLTQFWMILHHSPSLHFDHEFLQQSCENHLRVTEYQRVENQTMSCHRLQGPVIDYTEKDKKTFRFRKNTTYPYIEWCERITEKRTTHWGDFSIAFALLCIDVYRTLLFLLEPFSPRGDLAFSVKNREDCRGVTIEGAMQLVLQSSQTSFPEYTVSSLHTSLLPSTSVLMSTHTEL